jgi:hypothetical protein
LPNNWWITIIVKYENEKLKTPTPIAGLDQEIEVWVGAVNNNTGFRER